MKVIYFNSRGPDLEAEKSLGVRFANFDDLLRSSDIVSVHTPLTDKTYHYFGSREFALMKKSAVFVNASRGGVVDTTALVEALKSQRIFAAGLDVYEKEPLEPDNPLLDLENVVLAPHLGSASVNSRSKMAELAATNLVEALSGKVPKGLANLEILPKARHGHSP